LAVHVVVPLAYVSSGRLSHAGCTPCVVSHGLCCFTPSLCVVLLEA
jgi:hypothetical protein